MRIFKAGRCRAILAGIIPVIEDAFVVRDRLMVADAVRGGQRHGYGVFDRAMRIDIDGLLRSVGNRR